ncbi:MAG: hypothetical protein ACI9U0_001272 [Flavobacteriales bacterium]
MKSTGKSCWQHVWLNVILISGLITVIGLEIMSSPSLEEGSEPEKTFESTVSKNEEVKPSPIIPSEYNMECLSDPVPQQKEMNPETKSKIVAEFEQDEAINFFLKMNVEESETISESFPYDEITKEVSSKLNFEDLLPCFDTLLYTQGSILTHAYSNSKTVINLPNDLIKGAEIGEVFKLLYREYRNAAEMTYAKIPMLNTETAKV